jgi:hypothetical protein
VHVRSGEQLGGLQMTSQRLLAFVKFDFGWSVEQGITELIAYLQGNADEKMQDESR